MKNFFVIALLLICIPAFARESAVTLTIKPDRGVYELDEKVAIELNIANVGEKEIYLNTWVFYHPQDIETIVEWVGGIIGKTIHVRYNYKMPAKDDYVLLKPGDVYTAKVYSEMQQQSQHFLGHVIKSTGIYRIKIVYENDNDDYFIPGGGGPIKVSNVWKGEIISNVINIEVVENNAEVYTVEKVIDGDTLKLINGETVRLLGIDALESEYSPAEAIYLNVGKKWERSINDVRQAKEATEFVRSLLEARKRVLLKFDVEKKDEHERLLSYVYLKVCGIICDYEHPEWFFPHLVHFDDEVGMYLFLNAAIISSGYALPMAIPPNVKHADLFKELYQEAKEQRRGLWEVKFISEERAINIAKDGIKNSVNYPEEAPITVELRDGVYIVIFKTQLGEGVLGPDYHAQLSIDAVSGEVLKIMVGS